MGNIQDFNKLSNYRYRSFSNTEVPYLWGYGGNPYEERTIPASAPYTLLLHESPQFNVPSTTHIYDDDQAGIELEEVSKTTTPANNQYRVNYDEKGNGEIEFNAAQKGHDIRIQYYGLGSLAKIETLQSTVNAITKLQITTITTDTIMSDTQAAGIIALEIDCRTGDKDVTLPDASLNPGLQITVKQIYWGGRGSIKGKGVDTIDGYSEIYIDDLNDGGLLYSDGTEWKTVGKWKHRIKFYNESRPNSEWRNRHLGSLRIQYDNKVGTFTLGEVLVESDTGLEFILMYDDGTYLYVKNAEGNATNNKVLTGQTSGATCDVNQATGSTNNIDSSVFYNAGINILNLKRQFFMSSAASLNGAYEVNSQSDNDGAGGQYGLMARPVNTNSFDLQTGAAGIRYLMDNGTGDRFQTNSGYYFLYLEVNY